MDSPRGQHGCDDIEACNHFHILRSIASSLIRWERCCATPMRSEIRRNISTTSRTSRSPRTCSISPGTSSTRGEALRAGQIRGPVRNGVGRPHQSKTRRQADHREGAPSRRERGRPDGRLRKSIGTTNPGKDVKPAKKPRKVASGQKEMLMPIAGKKPAKEAVAKKPSAKSQR
jgi:hypothetical protein